MVWMWRQIIFIYFLLVRARCQKWRERILKDQVARGSILFWARSSGRPHPPTHCPFFLRLQEKNWSRHLLSAASHLQWELPQHCWWILTLKLIQADLPISSQSLVTLRLISRLSTLSSWEKNPPMYKACAGKKSTFHLSTRFLLPKIAGDVDL